MSTALNKSFSVSAKVISLKRWKKKKKYFCFKIMTDETVCAPKSLTFYASVGGVNLTCKETFLPKVDLFLYASIYWYLYFPII